MSEKTYDSHQQEVIDITSGVHLVLAAPGCGKTDVLAERIVRAHARGVPFEDMLCLTFTNRAARGMRERIESRFPGQDTDALFVGNVHHFCNARIVGQGVLAADTAIVDAAEAESIILSLVKPMEDGENLGDLDRRPPSSHARAVVSHIQSVCRTLHQREHGHPAEIVGAVRPVESWALTRIAKEMEEHPDSYASIMDSSGRNIDDAAVERIARAYVDYKRRNRLIDFDDIILLSYDALVAARRQGAALHRYRWVQVDEVQDLSPLQHAIIDLVRETEPRGDGDGPVTLYLGDDQQAIFSFMGAKLSVLEALAARSTVHHFARNYRCPGHLLRLLNTYAAENLGVDAGLLPAAAVEADADPDSLGLLPVPVLGRASGKRHLLQPTCRLATSLAAKGGTTAVLVPSNFLADDVSDQLAGMRVPHFKLSGSDIFTSRPYRILTAYLNVLANEDAALHWARLFSAAAPHAHWNGVRNWILGLRDCAMRPADLILHPFSSLALEFADLVQQGECVVFDTETTGLDTEADEIVQIAAAHLRRGAVVRRLNIFLETSRRIPAMLGDIPNPMAAAYGTREHLGQAEGVAAFLEFADGLPLVGHNVDYDLAMVRATLRRTHPGYDLGRRHPLAYDTLRLARILVQGERSYRLASLIASLHLSGTNSHLADDDVEATVQLARNLAGRARHHERRQARIWGNERVQATIDAVSDHLLPGYRRDRSRLDAPCEETAGAMLVSTARRILEDFTANGMLPKAPERFDSFLAYLEARGSGSHPGSLRAALRRLVPVVNAVTEADLCEEGVVEEKLIVSTVHKAKGLEFDNVVVLPVDRGTYPHAASRDAQAEQEDARKLYVALSRARMRLWCVATRGMESPFLEPVRHLLREGGPDER